MECQHSKGTTEHSEYPWEVGISLCSECGATEVFNMRKKCEKCAGRLIKVPEREPFCEAFWICENCDSTYCME